MPKIPAAYLQIVTLSFTEGFSMKNNKYLLPAARLLLCVTAVCFMAYGVHRGEVAVVLKKAINICLECIGLG